MKTILSTADGEALRSKYLRMCVNSLIGYVLVEVFAFLARGINLISTTYANILMLSLAVDCEVLGFIIFLYFKKKFTSRSETIFFFSQLAVFCMMFFFAVYLMNEIRLAALVFAMIAVTIELPFTTPKQSLFISFGSMCTYICASHFAIVYGGQTGTFRENLYIAISFIVPMSLIAYVARQLLFQKKEIEYDKQSLMILNRGLKTANDELTSARDRSNLEMELAGYVQSSLFPKEPPPTVGWDISLTFKPQNLVSGDFYDFYHDDSSLHGISLFDVSGHGVASGLITMIAKPIIQRIFNRADDVELNMVMVRVEEIFSREIRNLDNFITGILLRFRETEAEYVNVGHPDILLRRAGSDRVEQVLLDNDEYRSMPIGRSFENPEFRTFRFPLGAGDILCLMTDGMLEGRSREKVKFGRERMIDSFRNAPDGTAQEIKEYILDRFKAFIGDASLDDDYVIIIVKKKNTRV